jgi:predicted RNA-binding Zn ribbon-like protein
MVTDPDAAPGDLELVRAFVNTLDVESGGDALQTPASLGRWLSERGLLTGRRSVLHEEHLSALEVREAIRALLLANNRRPEEPDAAALLDVAAGRAGLAVRFRPGEAVLVPSADGIDGALGRLLGIVATSMAEGTWGRLKACRSAGCAWAFYDSARNRSRAWCSMAGCGNRAKARAYRQRVAAGKRKP